MARLPDSFLEELRARTPLPALIGRRVRLARSGRQWKGCCPFHGEKTPSFYVYDDHYHCFGCGAHGDAVGFVMQGQGSSFMEAVEILAGEAGLEVPKPSPEVAEAERRRMDMHGILESAAALYQQSLFAPEGAGALAYLRRRGLTEGTIHAFGLGYAGEGRGALARRLAADGVTPEQLLEAGLLRPGDDGAPRGELFFNRVMFPIRDRRGRVISFGGRILGDGQPKYVNGPETPLFSKRRTLYGLDTAREAVRSGAPVVAVEGYMDVIALHQAGFTGAVAPLGTALTDEQLDVLWQLSPAPTLCFDGDSAGANAAVRAVDTALPHLATDRTIRIARLPNGEDPDTLIRTQGPSGFTAVLTAARPLAEALFDQVVREVGGARTPEQRDDLFKKLKSRAAKIGDRGLASEYQKELVDRCKEFLGRSRTGYNRGLGAPKLPAKILRPVPGLENANAERIRALTAILIRHPAIPGFEEDLSTLALPPAADRLLRGVRDYAHQTENLDFTALLAHLHALGLAGDVDWALGDKPLPLPHCAGPDATAAEAAEKWKHFYGLMQRKTLQADVAAAERDFTTAPTTAAQRRHVALSAEQTAWRGGRLVSDDEPED